jgi:hypothetical protein
MHRGKLGAAVMLLSVLLLVLVATMTKAFAVHQVAGLVGRWTMHRTGSMHQYPGSPYHSSRGSAVIHFFLGAIQQQSRPVCPTN